jgi:hypothetical protein
MQQEFMHKFANAVKYGLYVKVNPALCEYYRKKRPDLSPYHAAISDFMTRPIIERVDVNEYKGHPGDVVTISAWDKWNIEGIGVVIFNAIGEVIEFGEAVPKEFSGNTEWDYMATVENVDYKSCRILVRVKDLPGNTIEAEADIGGT